MIETLVGRLVEYGWPGIFVGFLVWLLIRRDRLIDELTAANGELHEKRIAEALRSSEALREAAGALDTASRSIESASVQAARAVEENARTTERVIYHLDRLDKSERGGRR